MPVICTEQLVFIAHLESAINCCRDAIATDPACASDLNVMITLYGSMIYLRQDQRRLDDADVVLAEALSRWSGGSATGSARKEGESTGGR